MTDEIENNQLGSRGASFSTATVTEESENNSTINAPNDSAPLADLQDVVEPIHNTQHHTHRRISAPVLQAFPHFRLLTTQDARKGYYLVESGQQLPENIANDTSTSFQNGQLLTIMMATWNTCEAEKLYQQNITPTTEQAAQQKERILNDMRDILLPLSLEHVSDLIIMCTQEMSVVQNRYPRNAWEILLQEAIGPWHVLFHSVHFGALSLCIFLRRELMWHCTKPEEDIVRFRIIHPIRTKASLAVTFNIFATSFMIINSHFEAGDDSEGRSNRRLNFQNTLDKLSIPHEFIQRTRIQNRSLPILGNAKDLKHKTKSCDCFLWAGDMNFRLNMTYQEVIDLCRGQNYDKVLLKDEFLVLQQKTNDRYGNFEESKISFPPTYKFDLRSGTNNYVENRIPSYTDRILHRAEQASEFVCTQYKSVDNVKHSDHKPVFAHFCLKLKPGLHKNLSYGKFNYEVYKRGCEQLEQHYSLGINPGNNGNRRSSMAKSSVCVLL
ncbi:unnamed protein product [Rotaria sordida]|uniref:Inositol polyphosphate-related phosphatase domain-containing protein n=1 Tax=Rotaria sordida TaxID=392033 RepID=A0A815ACP8_9BILA|nr:unnamed protein product [Rotaria sordida]CAF1535535.1 unnamed protein product [Rotaria sordida]